jgi:mannosyltransferase OCH1-like enzyme
MWEHVNKLKHQNSGWSYRFYDDQDIISYVQNVADFSELSVTKQQYVQAHNSLIPGAAKADLFRYLVMYNEGGCYIDIDVDMLVPLHTFIREGHELVTSCDHVYRPCAANNHRPWEDLDHWNQFSMQQFLAYIPNHPFMRRVLELSVSCVINQKFVHAPPCVPTLTGPRVLDRAVHEVLELPYGKFNFTPGDHTINNISFALISPAVFHQEYMSPKYKGYLHDMTESSGVDWRVSGQDKSKIFK